MIVDEVGLTSGGGLAGVDVADNDDVDVSLLLTVERAGQRWSLIQAQASMRLVEGKRRRKTHPMVAVVCDVRF